MDIVWDPKNVRSFLTQWFIVKAWWLPHRVETCSQFIINNKIFVFDGKFLIFIIPINTSRWLLSNSPLKCTVLLIVLIILRQTYTRKLQNHLRLVEAIGFTAAPSYIQIIRFALRTKMTVAKLMGILSVRSPSNTWHFLSPHPLRKVTAVSFHTISLHTNSRDGKLKGVVS